ncbi:anthranilate synthase component I [bacterium]
MIYPEKSIFLDKAETGKIVPIYKELSADCETPVSAFLKFKDKYDYLYLLESVEENAQIGRYSFIGIDVETKFTAKDKNVIIETNGIKKETTEESPLCILESFTGSFKPILDEDLPPFYGGAVGYVSYDTVKFFEKLSDIKKKGDINVSDLYFVFARHIIIFDKLRNTMKIVCNTKIGDNLEDDYNKAINELNKIEKILSESSNIEQTNNKEQEHEIIFKSNTTKKEFMDMVEKGRQYIHDGDVFQVVLSQRWELDKKVDSFDLYRNIRTLNPSPYMFYLKFDEVTLIGSSPEVMVKGNKHEIVVRPIAGTRPRGETVEQDLAKEKELLKDEKECAEHVMLVDLGRNDVGRIADPGTVNVDEFKVIERYSHVMHIVSQVRGNVSDGAGLYDAFRAAFPAGTVTGAPKIRAMEIIEELEKSRRGPYAGAVAYIAYSGNFDSCITIRTIVEHNNTLYFQAGAGIVADSDPLNEFNETLNKIKALFIAAAETLGIKDPKIEESTDGKSIKLKKTIEP